MSAHDSENDQKGTRSIIFIILMLAALVQAPLDLYAPSLPHLAASFGAGHAAISLTITFCLLGLGMVQLFSGPLMDIWGRKPVVLWGLGLATVAPLMVLVSPTMGWVIFSRFVEGCGSGILLAGARVLMLDRFIGKEIFRVSIYIGLAIGASHVFSPLIGGCIQQYLGWHSNFIFLFVAHLLLFFFVFLALKRDLPFQPVFVSASLLVKNYRVLVRRKVFLGGVLIAATTLSMSAIFSLFASFLMQSQLGYNAVAFGYVSLLISVFYFFGACVAKKLLKRFFPMRIIYYAFLSSLIVSLAMFLLSLLSVLTVYLIVLPACLIALCSGMAIPNVIAYCLSRFKQISALSSGLFGACSGIFSAILAMTMTNFHLSQLWPLAGFLLVMSGLNYLFFRRLLFF